MPTVTAYPIMDSNKKSDRTGMAGALGRLVLLQVGLTGLAASVLGLILGWPVAYAVALGGAAVFLPAALGALRVAVASPVEPRAAWRAQISAQTLKWVGTLCIFGGTFWWYRDVQALWVFLGFGLVHLVYWVALLTDR